MECTQLCGNLFAVEIRNGLDIGKVAFLRHDNQVGCIIVVRKVDFLSSLACRTHSGDNHIKVTRLNRRDKAVPLIGIYLKFLAHCIGNFLSHLNIITVCIHIVHIGYSHSAI